MIRFRVPIHDTENTIIAPSIVSILNRLKTVLYLDKKAHLVLKNEENEYINKNWNIGNTKNTEANSNRTTTIEIEYTLSYEELSKNTNSYRNNQVTPILYSDETKFKTSVLYFDTKMNINFKILSKSKTAINTLLNELRMRFISDRSRISHDLTYEYYLNNFFKSLIANFTYNKNLIYGTEITPSEYLSTLIDDRFTYLGTMDNDFTKVVLGFKETQSGVLGSFKNDLLDNKKSYDKETGYWETNLEYEVTIKQPMFYEVEYYKIAYQYELDKAFTTLMTTEKKPIGNREREEELMHLFAFDNYTKSLIEKTKLDYIRIPKDDTDTTISNLDYYDNIYSVLFTLRLEDIGMDKIIYNLKDDIGIVLDDYILQMLEDSEYEHINSLFNSLFNISLYCHNTKLSENSIYVDKYLNVRTNIELNLNCVYRIVFSLNTDLNVLMPRAKDRIINNYKDILDEINSIIKNYEYVVDINNLDSNSLMYFQKAMLIAYITKG